jgi:dihydrofolate reductase
MTISLIAAMAANRCIGRDGRMPWHLPPDLARFKAVTLGHPLIMGRKTWDSILVSLGRPLPGRTSIVVTRGDGAAAAARGARIVATPEAALALAGAGDCFVIGGAQIYAQLLPRADRLVMTEIARDFEGDAFFPAIVPAQWREVSRARQANAGDPPLSFDFVEYARR